MGRKAKKKDQVIDFPSWWEKGEERAKKRKELKRKKS